MKMKINISILILSILSSGCAIFSNHNAEEDQSLIQSKMLFDKNIAVLNFEKNGSDLPAGVERSFADRLSQNLFMTGKFNTIDRSIVNNAHIEFKIKTTEILSPDKIKELGKALDANYLIFGKITDAPDYQKFMEDPKGKLSISIRIISAETMKIVGAATLSIGYDNDLLDKLDFLVHKLSRKILSDE